MPTLLASNANAENSQSGEVICEPYRNGTWYKIQTDLITILFPAGGKKPMFLWWYANDTDNIYVVKYKGLIEYLTLDYAYYTQKWEADGLTLQERLMAKYAAGHQHRTMIENRIRYHIGLALLGLHPAYLPFSACKWKLSGPTNVSRPDGVWYLSFNFTLEDASAKFAFAENNVVIRCRFYGTDAVEDVYGLYNYTVKAGELKMDFVVGGWVWNIDKLDALFSDLEKNYGITAPKLRSGLALWIDLASINITDIPVAEQDLNLTAQTVPEKSSDDILEPVEASSGTSDMIAEGRRLRIQNRLANEAEALGWRNRLRNRFRLQFAKGSQTLAGFFDFVDVATVINSTSGEKTVVNVTAAYKPAGNHMRLFLGYPYFGDSTLEHDPSIGV
ncbi:MAG: hypothetical protein QW840_03750, partial [Candidatus Bathyarchaeia archaeon]